MCDMCNISAQQIATDEKVREDLWRSLRQALENSKRINSHIHVGLSAAHDPVVHDWRWGVIVWADIVDDRCDHGHWFDPTVDEPPAALFDSGWLPTTGTPRQCHDCGFALGLEFEPAWNTITPTPGVCVMEETEKLAVTMSTEWEQGVVEINAGRRAKLATSLRRTIKEAHGMTRDEFFEQVAGWPGDADDEGIIWDEGQPTPRGAFMPEVHGDDAIVVTIEDLT